MKKLAYLLSVLFLFTAFAPAAMAKSPKTEKAELTVAEQNRLNEIEMRVAEIKSMDLRDLNKEERKEVRNELKEMKKEARELGRGVYLSVGAIIIILLVLILVT